MNEAKLKLWKSQYTPKGQHGIEHCKNVETYGVCLARELGADEDVIRWFAYIHDSQRENDLNDVKHGERAAQLIDVIRNSYLAELSNVQIRLLKFAVCHHTTKRTTNNITINCCWDADRYDLRRIGITPNPLCMANRESFGILQRYFESNKIKPKGIWGKVKLFFICRWKYFRLPKTITIYRGCRIDEPELNNGTYREFWTTIPEVAMLYATIIQTNLAKYHVVTTQVSKKRITDISMIWLDGEVRVPGIKPYDASEYCPIRTSRLQSLEREIESVSDCVMEIALRTQALLNQLRYNERTYSAASTKELE